MSDAKQLRAHCDHLRREISPGDEALGEHWGDAADEVAGAEAHLELENSSRHFAKPETPDIFASLSTNNINTLSGTPSHSHSIPCPLAGLEPKRR